MPTSRGLACWCIANSVYHGRIQGVGKKGVNKMFEHLVVSCYFFPLFAKVVSCVFYSMHRMNEAGGEHQKGTNKNGAQCSSSKLATLVTIRRIKNQT
jgi:hypothetical protein